MPGSEIFMIFFRLFFTTGAAFFGIFLMAYTREAAWVAVILGVVIEFVAIMYDTFQFFGIISPSAMIFGEYPITEMLLGAMPSACYMLAFILVLSGKWRKRRR